MSVFIPVPISTVIREHEQPSRTYKLDFERGRILAVGSCDGLDAINQFIKKALLTPRFRCLIYDNQYGSEIKQTIIAEDATRAFIETDLQRIVSDALLVDSRILNVYGFSFEFKDEKVHAKFSVSTIFGEIIMEEVL